jgi:hypothetical protein
MKTIRLLTVVACLVVGGAARASHTGPELSTTFLVIEGLTATSPNNVFQQLTSTEIVADHGKRIGTGTLFNNLSTTEPASLSVWLIWRDVPGGETYLSTPYNVNVAPGEHEELVAYIDLPYTPRFVGLRIQNNGPGERVYPAGNIIHQTIPIPEPSALALAAIAAVGLLARHRRRVAHAERGVVGE